MECDKELTEKDVEAFAAGITTGELSCLPAEMKIIDEHTALVEICEGKFHQVKKMFQAVGANVTYLKRLRIGGVWLDETLEKGTFRELSPKELHELLCTKHGI